MDSLNVVMKSRKKTYYEGPADTVSSINDTGPFDILPQHANFITMIKDNIVFKIPGEDTPQKFEISKGVMRVYENSVNIYLTVS
jgi:F0F1-type ATP synthase epsilon subunit